MNVERFTNVPVAVIYYATEFDKRSSSARLKRPHMTQVKFSLGTSAVVQNNGPRVDDAPLIVLDPGLNSAEKFMHHWSLFSELQRISAELGLNSVFYGSAKEKSDNLGIIPHFTKGIYINDAEIRQWLNKPSELFSLYEGLNLARGARLLMHTACPWHMEGILQILKKRKDISVSLGLILPVRFWTKDPLLLAVVTERMQMLIDSLRCHDVFFYNETGEYKLAGNSNSLPVLFAPLSYHTLHAAEELRIKFPHANGARLKFGFFGLPKKEKGFDLLKTVIEANGISKDMEMHLYIPDSVLEKFFHLNSFKNCYVHVRESEWPDMLAAIASVDVIFCLYDPSVYKEQMSQIVSEAILLGRPLIISIGSSLQKFVHYVSPNSAIAVDYSKKGLEAALALPRRAWVNAGNQARNSSKVMAELKSGDRFVDIVFGLSAQ
jgi:hypothetical protein